METLTVQVVNSDGEVLFEDTVEVSPEDLEMYDRATALASLMEVAGRY